MPSLQRLIADRWVLLLAVLIGILGCVNWIILPAYISTQEAFFAHATAQWAASVKASEAQLQRVKGETLAQKKASATAIADNSDRRQRAEAATNEGEARIREQQIEIERATAAYIGRKLAAETKSLQITAARESLRNLVLQDRVGVDVRRSIQCNLFTRC